ncbi:glycosyltransferase family 2 protein [Exiguobacterium acetylicum]|uniref:glycosyltransferase family 2 protein n=1 Tax=Exiguobacterium acetylicum TaxID=41170 RepID=UPI001EE1CF0D|nr:glycosyltransferase family 2 protein [Exiguobacterium acetylicum]UKS57360.1 glycosyltransferase family 2 protein [Exiguobacterium acetylicum]
MEKIISIIIPVYNKAAYLSTCIESIQALTLYYSTIEAIFVDDGSTDESLSILHTAAKTMDFIRIIELPENTGSPAQPRNVGIEEATGTYVTFLDADDRLDSVGFPQLVAQAASNDADIAFGQTIKHTDTSIQKVGRFASFTTANQLVPYEIDKVFRAVGPPGKILKRSVLIEHNIRFSPMKFGEDKLFFFEAISKCQTASMNPAPVYHVNRFAMNDSLVGQTSIFEKTAFNLQVLEKTLELDIPAVAKTHALSRLIEMDFLSRLFNNKRFLEHPQHQTFFDLFHEMIAVFERHNADPADFIFDDIFQKQYALLQQEDYDSFVAFITLLVQKHKAPRYTSEGRLYYRMPESLHHLGPVLEPFFATYAGTRLVDDVFYEVVQLLKDDTTSVDHVLLIAPNDEATETDVPFRVKGNELFIPTEALERHSHPFQLMLIHDDYHPFVVRMTLPSSVDGMHLHYQQLKAEFRPEEQKSPLQKIDATKYHVEAPTQVVVLEKAFLYDDLEFEHKQTALEVGQLLTISDLQLTIAGTPRLVTADGAYVTANKKYVHLPPAIDDETYLTVPPKTVRILKTCKQYADRDFKNELPTKNTPDTVLQIEKVVLSSKGTPRLKTAQDTYITANRSFVQSVNEA